MMQRHTSNGLSQALLDGAIEDGDTVRIEPADDQEGLTFESVAPAAASNTSANGAATVGA